MTTLHYIYDPLCGWCYGAAPLVKVARAIVSVRPHGGGMMTGDHRQTVTAQLRDYVMSHDARIARQTGQHFGEAYTNGLLGDPAAVLDSEPPIAAMLAAEELAGSGLDMVARLQVAHYVGGRRIAERAVLLQEAAAIGLDSTAFATVFDQQSGQAAQTHIHQTRQFMRRVGASGFPALVLERDGSQRLLDITRYLGRPQDFEEWLRSTCITAVPERT